MIFFLDYFGVSLVPCLEYWKKKLKLENYILDMYDYNFWFKRKH